MLPLFSYTEVTSHKLGSTVDSLTSDAVVVSPDSDDKMVGPSDNSNSDEVVKIVVI